MAHEATWAGKLPSCFGMWDPEAVDGRTVRYALAEGGRAPAGHGEWERRTFYGWTMYHSAAAGGCLPALTAVNWRTASG
ncbi:MAG: hypothetical protein LBR80_10860 [Deltaproteobacteria bacterium]|nr:hypothetical protein [Deltaproteobacteria bacterium]